MIRDLTIRLGRRGYVVLLRLLPATFLRRAQNGLLAAFEDGQFEHAQLGVVRLIIFTLKEYIGLFVGAIAARRTTRGNGPRLAQSMRGGVLGIFHILQDLRFALRNLRRHPSSTVLAIVTFAVGVGASSAMFGVIDTVVIRPLPFPDSHELVSVYPTIPEWRGNPTLDQYWDRASFSYLEFAEWRRTQTSFVSAAAIGNTTVTVTGQGEPERVPVARVTWELFPMLGVTPVVGRLFDAQDDANPDQKVVLLHEPFWQRRFGGDTTVVGNTVRLGQNDYTVTGIVPAWFELADRQAVAWTPISRSERENREDHNLAVIARLASGVDIERAGTESTLIFKGFSGQDHTRHGVNVVPRLRDVTSDVRGPLFILVGAAVVLLVVACANVAALVLGTGIEREEELAVRGALGAGRPRILAQLVTEGLALAAAGGALGVFITNVMTRVLVQLAPTNIPRLDQASVDTRIILFTLGISVASGLAFSLFPAVSLSRTDLARAIQGNRVLRAGRTRLQASLVVGELVFVTVLLVGAGLLTKTLIRLNALDPGVTAENLLTVRIAPNFSSFLSRSASTGDDDRGLNQLELFYQNIREELEALPGVSSVALTSVLPFTTQRGNNNIYVEGYEMPDSESLIGERHFVSENYVEVMGMRVVDGRGFVPGDDHQDATPVVLINERLSRHTSPNESPIGKRFTFWEEDYTIVGVVADVRQLGLAEPAGYQFYVPRAKRPGQGGSFALRTSGDPVTLANQVRERVWSVDPDVPVTSVIPMTSLVRDSVAEQRYRTRLMLAFSGIAVFMALLGVYGVTARMVAMRTRELGIRAALGAERSQMMSLVLRHGLGLALAGATIGLLVSIAAAKTIESLLFGTEPTDLTTFVAVAAIVALMSLLASLAPALRATRIDPLIALRD